MTLSNLVSQKNELINMKRIASRKEKNRIERQIGNIEREIDRSRVDRYYAQMKMIYPYKEKE